MTHSTSFADPPSIPCHTIAFDIGLILRFLDLRFERDRSDESCHARFTRFYVPASVSAFWVNSGEIGPFSRDIATHGSYLQRPPIWQNASTTAAAKRITRSSPAFLRLAVAFWENSLVALMRHHWLVGGKYESSLRS